MTKTEAIICCLWAVTNDSTSNGKQLKCNYIRAIIQTFSPLLSLSSVLKVTQQENINYIARHIQAVLIKVVGWREGSYDGHAQET